MIVLIYLKKVNTSKVRDVELLSVQDNNSGDTLFVNGVLAGMAAVMNILVNSWWNPKHYLTLYAVQSMIATTLKF